jgi:ketosteroid isomerase-like protein
MKGLLLLAGFIMALTCAPLLFAQSKEIKIKAKDGNVVVRDKSKPVRKALEAWYDSNIAAFKAKDAAAVMALRTGDFHTLTPDGKTNSRADMEGYTQRLLSGVDHFISMDFQIGTIEVNGDLASADVTQKTVRMQRLQDGQLHKVEAGAVQKETWKKTAEGWKLYRVENVRSTGLLVDDMPFTQNR